MKGRIRFEFGMRSSFFNQGVDMTTFSINPEFDRTRVPQASHFNGR